MNEARAIVPAPGGAVPLSHVPRPEGSKQMTTDVAADLVKQMILRVRARAKDFEAEARVLRLDAKEKEVRAGERYNAFISFDLLADKLEKDLASAIEARRAETRSGSVADESAAPKADAQNQSEPSS